MGLLVIFCHEQKVRPHAQEESYHKTAVWQTPKEDFDQRVSLSRSVSRILSSAVIYLGRELPLASGSLPGGYPLWGRERVTPRSNGPSLLLGLAPSGGCLAAPVARCAGGLLHHLFTLAWSCDLRRSVSVALSPSRLARVLPGAAPCGVRTFLTPVAHSTPERDYLTNSSSTPDILRIDVPSIPGKRPLNDFRRCEEPRAGRT
jgi:hypothetical protein